MNNSITLKEAIDEVLKCQRENGHSESYLADLRRTYNRRPIRYVHGTIKYSDLGQSNYSLFGHTKCSAFSKTLVELI